MQETRLDTARILGGSPDERLTAAVEATGKSPQYIVDEALSEYLSRLEVRAGHE